MSASALATARGALRRKRDKPAGVVFIIADDMRWDALGAAGNRIIHTPRLDALAADGALFLNHFVTTSICPASRASILCGQYARRHGVWGFRAPLGDAALRNSFPAAMRRAGWRTGFIGKWGLAGPAPEEAFDVWRGFLGQGQYFDADDETGTHLTARLAGQAEAFLESGPSEQPFCLIVSAKAPHVQDGDPEPFQPDPRYAELYRDVVIPRPPTATRADFERLPRFLRESEGRRRWERRFASDAQYQRSVKQYYRLVSGLDDLVGRVIGRLKRLNRYDDSWIVFTSDNGFFLGEHGLAGKWWGFEEAIRTPLIIKPPGGSGRRVHAMTLNIDLCPTALAAAGLETPTAIQGRDLAPLLRGKSWRPRKAWLYEHLFKHPRIARSEGVRTQRYKYLEFLDRADGGELLFDLRHDPHETVNLADLVEHRHTRQRLRNLLQRLKREAV